MKHNKRLIRIIAIVLAVLLAGGVVFGALFGALSEEQTSVGKGARSQCALEMEYLEDEQALRITQRLVYVNPSSGRLKDVVFYAAGNMFRRQDGLMYGAEDAEKVFFAGYQPAGIDLRTVLMDGKPTDFGFQGEDELYLRVACDLEAGQACEFQFDYYLLLMNCGAFQGVGDTDVRLSAFCFIPGVYDDATREFQLKKPLSYARWLYCDAADFTAELTLPAGWLPACTGTEALAENNTWRIEAKDVRDFALCFGRRYRTFEGKTASGVAVRVLTNVRGAGGKALAEAIAAIERCEAWFGPFPVESLDIAQSDYPLGAMNFPGLIWVPGEMMDDGEALAHQLRRCVAQQYFGLSAYADPTADAWLSDAVSEYVACLLLEAETDQSRFLSFVNRDWVSALQQTVPGGLNVSSDAALFDEYSYDIVVRKRGAVVLHELRLAMGLEPLLEGLANFYRKGAGGGTLTVQDFVDALDATGGSWEDFLADWVYNVGKYVDQTMVWYE